VVADGAEEADAPADLRAADGRQGRVHGQGRGGEAGQDPRAVGGGPGVTDRVRTAGDGGQQRDLLAADEGMVVADHLEVDGDAHALERASQLG
jgi:hypothetical protein